MALAQTTNPALGRPFFLEGTVVLEDGSPPPEPVPIVRSCGGGAGVPLGFTDADGRSNFGASSDPSAMMDVQNSVAGGPFAAGYHDLMGCELRAVATGFSSDAINLGSRKLLDNPHVGTIVLRRLEGVLGSVFSNTTIRARKDARKAHEKGRALVQKQRYDEAAREYERALRVAPHFAAAWFELGLVHQIQGHFDEAKKAYREAVTADPEYVRPYRQLAALSFQEQDWPAVLEATKRLLWLDPLSYPDGYFYDAVARFYQNDIAAAEESAREAVHLDSDGKIPRARYVLAAILIERQDYAAAAAALRDYVKHAPPGPELEQARSMLAQLDERLGAAR
jgi:tetratricopeptide (TPR) repeat protein